MGKTPAEMLIEREKRVAYAAVPKSLFDLPLAECSWQMSGDEFLLRGEGDHYFHYRKGAGVTVYRGPGVDISEESLWLNGSVHAAIASINGLLPIHASAIAWNDRVFAFTGPAGAGKSTIVAALSDRGFPMFCDDTLVLDLSGPDQILCLPGHKRLKLAPDALDLTAAISEEKVSATVDKFYARPQAGDVGVALPLARLIYLEEGPDPAVAEISGSDRFLNIQDDHYTTRIFAHSRKFDRAAHFAHLAGLSTRIDMARFSRPRTHLHFEEAVSVAENYVRRVGART